MKVERILTIGSVVAFAVAFTAFFFAIRPVLASAASPSELASLVTELKALQSAHPTYAPDLQLLINELYTSASGAPTDQTSKNFLAGGYIDFSGRNFDREQDITITLAGTVVGHAHADGGGNFTTGRILAPGTAGLYTYTFTEANGKSMTSTVRIR